MGEFDLLVIGGGINGAGIARDAAGRGLSVILVEKDDLAAHTSSASSKLIHGGLRYLEQLDFRLVRESLTEREILLRAAPHIVEPLEFVVPMTPLSRPAWKIRTGLFLYDHLARRTLLPGSRSVALALDARAEGLKTGIDRGFAYWDCKVQDSRLVVLNAIDAAERGAVIATRTKLLNARREGARWVAQLRGPSGGSQSVTARALVNAAGPWAGALLGLLTPNSNERRLRLVKGSHIVMPRLYPGDHAFLLQGRDGRVVFAIPFEQHFTLVGTTDVDCYGPPDDPAISKPEVEYLLDTISRTFTAQVSSRDIVWSFAGIRALNDDGTGPAPKATREYALDLDAPEKTAPLLNVFGGKLTTYRRLSERAVDRLSEYFMNVGPPWTERACLPGGDIPNANIAAYAGRLAHNCPSLRPALIARLVRTYGARTAQLLDGVRSTRDLGECFGADLYAREVEYLVSHEWARSPQDILFRRTKLGLRIGSEGAERLTAFLPLSD